MLTHSSSLVRKTRLLTGSASAVMLLALAVPAYAQDQAPAAPAPAPAPAAPEQAAPAATAPAAQAAPAEQGGQDIVVTGSLFRRANTETPSPVTVLSAQTLARAGITNVSDAIRSISADSSGSIPTSFTNGFGAGSSAVSLRGLTVNSTLTVIDGLRTAQYPLADDGQRAFVDLNTIPDAIVDRVEVLKDGASSTYGADAIGGVVNIITKKEFTGIAGLVEGGVTQRGDGGEQRAQLTLGTGSLKEKGFNVYISGEYEHDDAIYNRDRGFPYNTADLTSIGGDNNNPGSTVPGTTTVAIVAPTTSSDPKNILSGSGITTGPWQFLSPNGCVGLVRQVSNGSGVSCEQNTAADYGQIQPQQTRFGVNARGTVQINDKTTAYLSVGYNQNNVVTSGVPRGIRSSNPIFAQNIVLPALLSNGQLNPYDPYAAQGQPAAIRYLFGDVPFGSTYNSHVIRGAAGVAGEFGDGWRYSADVTAVHSWLDISQRGYINVAGLTAAVNDGTYNFANPSANTAAIRAQISPVVTASPSSDLDMVQGVISKDLFQLPGGPLQVGVGGSIRYEAVNNPTENPGNGTFGLNAVTAVGHHTVSSAYFEVGAPILKSLEVNVSGRFDHYQEGYDRFSPKVGAKFTPFKQLAIRGTYSKGFRAPSFSETAGSVVGFTSARLPCSAQVTHGAVLSADGATCSGGSAYNQSYSIGFNTAATPTIKPELSRSFTGGAIFQPVRWLSFTVDYYNIKKTQVITGGPLSNVAINNYYSGQALPAGYTITQDAVDPNFPNAIRRVLFVNAPYANAAALKTSGIDFGAELRLPVASGVRLISRADVTDILEYKFDSGDGTGFQDYVGTQAPYVTSSGAGTPRWRGSWQNTVEAGPYSLTATAYYTSGYKAVAYDQFGTTNCNGGSTYGGTDPNFNCRVKSFIDVDLVGNVEVNKKFSFYFNVINLLDAKAPLNAGNYAATNYNPTYTQIGAVGRSIRFGARFKY
ncbi:TonB-dependent receptor domain-containing protein [Sphingomonas sp. PAMC 26605]|uniref:TonB-dependent receptor domain-containing protein n=1 Tax=Sphingomonas sp. PAMC 26605 TaxID=1112214 RepID=UPI001E306CBC|nr:TonB-dependent receptor [Sphingomonas sp. PAMC 26605]